jgi:hypothetical protein
MEGSGTMQQKLLATLLRDFFEIEDPAFLETVSWRGPGRRKNGATRHLRRRLPPNLNLAPQPCKKRF